MLSSDDDPVCTLFFAGFPPDMQVREFVNMFTFLPGFIAAVLKKKQPDDEITTIPMIPSNDSSSSCLQYSSSQVPTANSAANALDKKDAGLNLGKNTHSQNGLIGFARFRTPQEAIYARNVFNGMKVDAHQNCTLRVEMAKKNLHVKKSTLACASDSHYPPLYQASSSVTPGSLPTFSLTNSLPLQLSSISTSITGASANLLSSNTPSHPTYLNPFYNYNEAVIPLSHPPSIPSAQLHPPSISSSPSTIINNSVSTSSAQLQHQLLQNFSSINVNSSNSSNPVSSSTLTNSFSNMLNNSCLQLSSTTSSIATSDNKLNVGTALSIGNDKNVDTNRGTSLDFDESDNVRITYEMIIKSL